MEILNQEKEKNNAPGNSQETPGKGAFSNSSINKVAMVKNAFLIISLQYKKTCQITVCNIHYGEMKS